MRFALLLLIPSLLLGTSGALAGTDLNTHPPRSVTARVAHIAHIAHAAHTVRQPTLPLIKPAAAGVTAATQPASAETPATRPAQPDAGPIRQYGSVEVVYEVCGLVLGDRYAAQFNATSPNNEIPYVLGISEQPVRANGCVTLSADLSDLSYYRPDVDEVEAFLRTPWPDSEFVIDPATGEPVHTDIYISYG